MQLKLVRSQKSAGMVSKSVMFCLDARADLTEEEKHLIDKYKLGKETIYDSVARQKRMAEAGASLAGGGLLRGAVSAAMARLSLTVTVDSLCKGHHIEAKDLDELMGAEEALKVGCENLRAYLDIASTFDGREIVIDYDGRSEPAAA